MLCNVHTRAQTYTQGPRMNPEGGLGVWGGGGEDLCTEQDITSMIKHQLAHLLISSLDPGRVKRATKSKHLNSKHVR